MYIKSCEITDKEKAQIKEIKELLEDYPDSVLNQIAIWINYKIISCR